MNTTATPPVIHVVDDDAAMRRLRVQRLTSGESVSTVPAPRTIRSLSRFRLLGDDGVEAILRTNAFLGGHVFLESMAWSVSEYCRGERQDDMSAVLIEYIAPAETVSAVDAATTGILRIAVTQMSHAVKAVTTERGLGAVAVMHVEIDDRHPSQFVLLQGVHRGNRNVVEETKAHGDIRLGVMPRWAHTTKRILHFTTHDQINRLDPCPRCPQGCLPGMWIHRCIRIEMHNPVSGRNSLQAFQMRNSMNTHQLSERRQRRVMKLKKMIKPMPSF